MKTLKQLIETEPEVRALTEWTPQLIRTARILADAGNLSMAADLCDSFMSDERIQSCLNTRALGLQGLPLTFEADRGKKRAIKALEAEEDYWKMFPPEELALMHKWGIMLNVVPVQLIWEYGDDGKRVLSRMEVWHPRHLRQDQKTKQWFIKVGNEGREIEIHKGGKPDGKWMLFMPNGKSRPWSQGAWRALANWYLLKLYAIQDWGYYSEKNGQGILVAEGAPGSTATARRELAADLAELGRNSAISFPPGWSLKLVEASANTHESFEKQISCADTGTSICILGQNLSSEVKGAVATGATLHKYVFQFYINADAKSVPTCVHDQALVFYAEMNFGDKKYAPWPKYDPTPPEDKNDTATRIRDIGAGFKDIATSGAPVDLRELAKTLNFPVLPEGKTNVVPGAAADAAAKADTKAPADETKPDSGDVPIGKDDKSADGEQVATQ